VQAHTSLIAELEDSVHCGSSHKRAAVLARVTDLFVDGTKRFDDEQIGAFDDVLCYLIDKIETKALAELSQRLALLDHAPPRVIRRLASHDEIAVAGPVLRHAKQLDDDNLVDVAKVGSQDHLLAISVRSRLNEPVTDVLVDRGNSAVVHSIAENAGARFSENGITALVRHAENDEDLAGKIMERRDLPPQLFCRLLLQATEVVKERLLARARPETRQLIQQVLAKVSCDIAAGMPTPPDYGTALRDLLMRYPGGKLGDPEIRQLALDRRQGEMVAALSLLASMPVDVIERLLRGDDIGPVVILCKACGFTWATLRAVLQARNLEGLSVPKLNAARNDFDRLSRASAQQVLQLWQAREIRSDSAAAAGA
jgi:Uncharacterised protein conserved in bacteria (DUF2336)